MVQIGTATELTEDGGNTGSQRRSQNIEIYDPAQESSDSVSREGAAGVADLTKGTTANTEKAARLTESRKATLGKQAMENYPSTDALSFDDMNDAQRLYVRSPEGEYKTATRAQILAAGRKAANGLISKLKGMDQPNRVKDFFSAKLTGLGHEAAGFLYLDTQLKPIRYVELAQGTLSSASVYPREVVKTALRLNAAALILAHNHPSGNPEPSAADISLTRQLKQALALVDVRLLDHIVVSATGATSLAERGQV